MIPMTWCSTVLDQVVLDEVVLEARTPALRFRPVTNATTPPNRPDIRRRRDGLPASGCFRCISAVFTHPSPFRLEPVEPRWNPSGTT
ncbi:MAG: hypothetical protein R3E93_05760 [Thiothrix sp.]